MMSFNWRYFSLITAYIDTIFS